MSYSIRTETNLDFEDTVEKVKGELQKEGFGVLTEIDVKETLKKKLNVEYDNYIILGACNPPSAYKVLQTEKEIGLLLPCNVIIYSQNGKTIVSAINPIKAMSVVSNKNLKETAQQIKRKLKKVVEAVK